MRENSQKNLSLLLKMYVNITVVYVRF